jgi:hypothetical protein
VQKGNLASTVQGGGTSTRFSKDELKDCFSLKKCTSDTKRKISHWPSYDGASSLEELGCTDVPLVHIAETLAETLGYVRIVEDADCVDPSQEASLLHADEPAASPTLSSDQYDSDEEEEFEL